MLFLVKNLDILACKSDLNVYFVMMVWAGCFGALNLLDTGTILSLYSLAAMVMAHLPA